MEVENLMKNLIDFCNSHPEDLLNILFSGCGVAVVGKILSVIFQKKKQKQISNENALSCVASGEGNVVGKNTINNRIVNTYWSNEEYDKKEKSWFSERFYRFLGLLEDGRGRQEKEYTVEFVGSLIGLNDINELKKYLSENVEPNESFKEKFVEIFGVNKEWMCFNRGNYPFASNIEFAGFEPMDILRYSDLRDIRKFSVVVGKFEGEQHVCIVRQMSEFCYEVYPKYFIFNSNVGGTGKSYLVSFYRFIREANRIRKLDDLVYAATAKEMEGLHNGAIWPRKIRKFKILKGFIEDFLSIDEESIKRNSRFWDEEFVSVQKIISVRIEESDRINQQSDRELIRKNLGEMDKIENDKMDIDDYDISTAEVNTKKNQNYETESCFTPKQN